MAVRMTKVTRMILDHIYKYGFITAKQCSQIYYKNNKQGLIQAQVKLKNLYEAKIIKRRTSQSSNEYVYINDSRKVLSQHSMYLMNLYAYLYNKYEILYFGLEENWSISRKRNDAHIILSKEDGTKIGLLVEIDLFHQTSKDKLNCLYESNEVQQWYKDNYDIEYYPSILIVNETGRSNIKNTEYDIVCTDFNFNGLSDIL